MCGIAGICNLDGSGASKEIVARMTRVLAHRGPDGEGIELVDGVAFGHRRLSILDLACGAQPMYSSDRSCLVIFNGEIFNYLELKEELLKYGAVFSTTSDTEVILEAFARWGVNVFAKFNGQFAIALYDKRNQTLYLARDRMGEKPLYYTKIKNTVVFGSELKAIIEYMRACGEPLQLCPQATSAFHALNYVPFDGTFLKGVHSLAPGTLLQVKRERIHSNQYFQNPETQSINDYVSQLDQLLIDATKIRLRSDVPVGIFLSGGIDSTSVATALNKLGSQVKAFIASFKEEGFSEAPAALAACQQLGLPYEIIEVAPLTENLPTLIEELVYHGDQPLADSSALPVYLLSRGTAQHVKVVLSGDGGDELFGGYLTYQATRFARNIPQPLRQLLNHLHFLAALLPVSDRKVSFHEKLDRFLRNLDLPPGAAHFAWNGMFSAHEKANLLHPDILREVKLPDTFSLVANSLGVDLESPSLSQLLRADQANYLVNDILAKTDRMSMAHGLEIRPAFMDYRLVDFARSLPEELLLKGSEGRVIVRDYLRRHAPWYSLSRPKQGFSIPIHLWFRTILKESAEELFHSQFARTCGVYNFNYLASLWDAHQKRKRNLGFELWGVMVSLLWMRRFMVNREKESTT